MEEKKECKRPDYNQILNKRPMANVISIGFLSITYICSLNQIIMIKNLLVISSLCFCFFAADAQSIRMPQPSPSQTIKQDFGIGNIELSYSRPGKKGRKVFGDLVPFGKVWRTGANQATTLTFSDSVTIGGTKMGPGKYGLLSIPDKNEWTFIITKQLDVTSPTAYKPEMDVVRVKAKPETTDNVTETFTIQFDNVRPSTADINVLWDNVSVKLPVSTNFDSRVVAQINNALRDNRPYFQAGMYYMETNRDLNQVVEWFDKAIAQNPNAFWVYHQKANVLAKLGKKDDARVAANKSIQLAKTAGNDDYVKLNEDLLKDLK